MTAKIDGTNGLLQQYDYQVLTTAFTYTFAAGTTVLVINPAGTLATGTITMPAAPADGMTISFSSTQTITALTVNANTGQSIVSAATVLPARQATTYVYRLSNTTWYPMSTVATNVPVAPAGGSIITSGTAVGYASFTTTTYNDFTGIPSWVKRITVMYIGVSTSTGGTSTYLVQIGDSGGIETTGYACNGTSLATSTIGTSNFTTGFAMGDSASYSAAATHSGSFVLTLADASTNTWTGVGTIAAVGQIHNKTGAGSKALSPGPLDRIRITTVNGTDTFDAGTVNILYE